MAILPTVDQFPTFVHTSSRLTGRECRCIWYLSDKGRCCLAEITNEVKQSALHLAQSILKASPLTKSVLQLLEDIAEQSCCGRHHRNKIWGSGLAKELAVRWQNEIQVTLSTANCRIAETVKPENVPPSIATISESSSELSDHSIVSSIPGRSNSNCFSTDQAIFTTHFLPPSKPVAFARHEVLKGETLHSKLLSPTDRHASRTGSLYIFTHAKDTFRGMIKIGYSSGSIDSRLSKWAECGHGYPILLTSYDGVRHPERVELLIHFELLEYWFAQRWCEPHRQAHIEWFKIKIGTASSISHLWSRWMDRANPYDRRGRLKIFWKENVDFLIMYEIPITAKVTMQIQEIEEGSTELLDFIDDAALCKRQELAVKHEQLD